MNITNKILKQIIVEELEGIMTESELMPWADKAGVGEEAMYDMLMVPGGIDMMSMLMKNGFQLKASGNEGMVWVTKTEQGRFSETIQLQFTVPKDGETPSVSYYATADEGFMKTNPFEKTFDNYEEAIEFVNWRIASSQSNPQFGT
jgi:hypothetical protein